MNNTKDTFISVNEIKTIYVQDQDYSIEYLDRDSDVTILAIHSGGIEGGTGEIAKEIANQGNYNYFLFNGLLNNQTDGPANLALHITSSKFSFEECDKLLEKTNITISVHGADEADAFSYIGGLDTDLKNLIKMQLRSAGFVIPQEIRKGLEGVSSKNICNKNLRSKGIQLEVSQGLRKEFFGEKWKNYVERQQRLNFPIFLNFCSCFVKSIEQFKEWL